MTLGALSQIAVFGANPKIGCQQFAVCFWDLDLCTIPTFTSIALHMGELSELEINAFGTPPGDRFGEGGGFGGFRGGGGFGGFRGGRR